MTGYESVLENLENACVKAKRNRKEVHLIVVSKTYAQADILPLLEAGHRRFGENKVQESQEKWPELKAQFPDIELHLIGPLQSNKAKDAVALFDVIQSVDRPKIAKALAKEMASLGKTPRLLVQVNTGAEPQKAGVLPQDIEAFLTLCQKEHGLNIEGLMCIPPVDEEAALHFTLLNAMVEQQGLSQCSMGMSSDYEKSIALGSTMVRVGTAIFGARG